MSQSGLIFWILGLPFLLAIVELIRTFAAIRSSSNSERGPWSRALNAPGFGAASPKSQPASGRR